jgi:D-3-phosphoglycerate dehydrogenase
MKVLVADTFEQTGLDGLKAAGCDVVYQPDLTDEALARAIADTGADVLVVRSTAVTGPMLEVGKLSLVVRAGAGYNTIDVATASRRGIYVSNCPGKNAIAVAELTMGLILSLDRRIPDNVAELRAGRWNKKEFSKARGVLGQTLGLLGYGNVGQEVARRAQAFGMPLLVWSRRLAAHGAPAEEVGLDAGPGAPRVRVARTPAELFEQSDIVSVHLALNRETRGLVNGDLLMRMKPGAAFVNTARGEIVDYPALASAAAALGLRVALDVFAAEPAGATGEFQDSLMALPLVYGTHHIGASTDQAQQAIAAETVRIVRSYKDTGKVPNVVNLARSTPATHMLVVRHQDRPGVLAHVFDRLREVAINVQETENIIFDGAHAAVARINLDGAPDRTALDAITHGNPDILDLYLVALHP